ncbi:hypothetical protein HMPREF7215_0421 [Pyramidobacter piscolens W5455]|uniref:Uncharacterized protein n=1 Tax=Pyramidobacter piscolens W5455 TaxID=352165 RepID=A0ABM9ZYA0_9BACT|nr:hypothetical protein HMPREF7215_0421 [Pyramidobacter piscolens W5455]
MDEYLLYWIKRRFSGQNLIYCILLTPFSSTPEYVPLSKQRALPYVFGISGRISPRTLKKWSGGRSKLLPRSVFAA